MNAISSPEPAQIANVEAEAALLGAMMSENRLIDRVADMVQPDDFSEGIHQSIFSAVLREHSHGRIANPVTLKPYFADDPSMAEVGGAAYLARLTGSGAAVVGATDIARQVADLAKRRRLVASLHEVITSGGNVEISVEELAADVEGALHEAMSETDGRTELSAGQCAANALSAIDRHDPGILSGIQAIDDAMGPIRAKTLAILAGRPGMGKTAVALGMAKGAAEKGHGVLFVSLEMSAEDLGERLLCDLAYDEDSGSGVPYDALVHGRVDREQGRWLLAAQERAAELPLHVVDVGSLKIGQLATMVRRWKRRFAAKGQTLGLVVVDYLQLLAPDYRMSGPYEAITAISKALKTIAKQNDVGVLALAQLSREVEKRSDKQPQLSDLRDSGQIEQDADAVMFVLREEYYLRKGEPAHNAPDRLAWEQSLAEVRNQIRFICAKRRRGAERTTEGRFYGAFQAVRG